MCYFNGFKEHVTQYADFNITVSNNMFCSVCRFWYFQRTLLSPDYRFWKSCSRLNKWRPVIFEDWPYIDFSSVLLHFLNGKIALFFFAEYFVWLQCVPMLSLRCVLCSVRSVAFRLCNIADAFNYLLYPHFCGLNSWTAQEKQKKSKCGTPEGGLQHKHLLDSSGDDRRRPLSHFPFEHLQRQMEAAFATSVQRLESVAVCWLRFLKVLLLKTKHVWPGAMWVDEVFTSCKIRERSAVTFVFWIWILHNCSCSCVAWLAAT